jgi:hypothetical protein
MRNLWTVSKEDFGSKWALLLMLMIVVISQSRSKTFGPLINVTLIELGAFFTSLLFPLLFFPFSLRSIHILKQAYEIALLSVNHPQFCFRFMSSPWQRLWSSGQSSWLQIQRSRFDSRRYHIFREVVGLGRGPLSLISTMEELRGRKSSGPGLENREYDRRDPSRWPRDTYSQKLALTSPTSGRRSVGIVHSRTQATEFGLVLNSPCLLRVSIFSLHPPLFRFFYICWFCIEG